MYEGIRGDASREVFSEVMISVGVEGGVSRHEGE